MDGMAKESWSELWKTNLRSYGNREINHTDTGITQNGVRRCGSGGSDFEWMLSSETMIENKEKEEWVVRLDTLRFT